MIDAPGPIVVVADLEHPELSEDAFHHLGRVLRLRPGAAIVVCDGAGRWRRAVITGGTSLEASGEVRFEEPPDRRVGVAFAPAKGDRPEWAVQKMTECGVDRIVPLMCDHGVVRWEGERGARATTKLERVALEAAVQCRRAYLPLITPPVTVDVFLALANADGSTAAMTQPGGPPPVDGLDWMLVGPEGGWSERELSLAPAVGLGPNVLRAETAAVVAGAFMVALRDGLLAPSKAARSPQVGATRLKSSPR